MLFEHELLDSLEILDSFKIFKFQSEVEYHSLSRFGLIQELGCRLLFLLFYHFFASTCLRRPKNLMLLTLLGNNRTKQLSHWINIYKNYISQEYIYFYFSVLLLWPWVNICHFDFFSKIFLIHVKELVE